MYPNSQKKQGMNMTQNIDSSYYSQEKFGRNPEFHRKIKNTTSYSGMNQLKKSMGFQSPVISNN